MRMTAAKMHLAFTRARLYLQIRQLRRMERNEDRSPNWREVPISNLTAVAYSKVSALHAGVDIPNAVGVTNEALDRYLDNIADASNYLVMLYDRVALAHGRAE